mgnify:CR=1 FL=1
MGVLFICCIHLVIFSMFLPSNHSSLFSSSYNWIFFLLRRRSGVCEWDSFYPCNNMLFRWRGKLLRNSGKTGVLNNFLFWQRHYKFGTENLKSLQITSHLCSQSRIHESEFRLFYWVVTQVVFLSQMMSSWLWNLFWFLSLGRKNVLASPQKWSVSGRRERFGFLVWQKSAFSFKTVNSQFATIDETTSSSGTWLKQESSNAQSSLFYVWEPQS